MEAAVIFPIILLIAGFFYTGEVHGSGIASVKVDNSIIPQGQKANGDCCDAGLYATCGSKCDPFFHICFNDPSVSPNGCSVGEITTPVQSDANEIPIMDPDVTNIFENPFEVKFESWPDTVDLKVTIKDWDQGSNSSEIVEEFQQQEKILISEAKEVMLMGETSHMLTITVTCDNNYFGSGCTTFCQPTEQYACGADGAKICKDGLTGENCEENVNECESSPCVHGTCEDLINAFKCDCEPGFVGPTCSQSQKPDLCSSSPCLHGGVCSADPTSTSFSCSCKKGFAGERCEVRTAPYACESNPCQGGGTCEDVGTSYRCVCSVERKGDNCETRIPHICDDQPCQNGGTCTRMGHAYRCVCPKGYFDVKCNRKIGQGAQTSKLTGSATSTSGLTLLSLLLPIFLVVK